jgi:anti-anti-sigma factor
MSGFSIDMTDDGDARVMTVSGEIDIEHADDLAAVGLLITKFLDGHGRLVIDLAGVPFMDSTGLGALVQIRNAVAGDGRRVELRSVHPRVRKILEITGLLDVFDVAPIAVEYAPGQGSSSR